MSANGSNRREAAAFGFARGLTVAAVATECKISERQLYRWRKLDDFAARVQTLRGELFIEACGKLASLSGKAADRLGELVDTKNEPVALGACRAVLEAGQRLREVLDFEGRLKAIEARLKEQREGEGDDDSDTGEEIGSGGDAGGDASGAEAVADPGEAAGGPDVDDETIGVEAGPLAGGVTALFG